MDVGQRGLETPIGQTQGKSSSGLLEFSSVPTAVEALILANHYTMHREGMEIQSSYENGYELSSYSELLNFQFRV